LREYAKLERDIVLAGMLKVVEIWSKERFEIEIQKSSDNSEGFTEHMANLGI